MTWDEHEKVYCKEVKPREKDVMEVFPTYALCYNYIDNYEEDPENFPLGMTCVRWEGRYYAVCCLSEESERYYQK